MSISDKIKAIDNKIEQNKDQFNLDQQTAKILALSLGNISKYGFLVGKDVLSEKDLLEKAAELKRFEYSLLGKQLKSQTETLPKKHYQRLANTDELDKTIKKEKPTLKKNNRSCIIYITNNSFYKYYCNRKNFCNLSFESRYSCLVKFFDDIDKFSDLIHRNENTKEKSKGVWYSFRTI